MVVSPWPGTQQVLSTYLWVEGREGGRKPLSWDAQGRGTCVVEGDCLFVCADLIGSLAAVIPSILWGHSLNDEGPLAIDVDSGVTM